MNDKDIGQDYIVEGVSLLDRLHSLEKERFLLQTSRGHTGHIQNIQQRIQALQDDISNLVSVPEIDHCEDGDISEEGSAEGEVESMKSDNSIDPPETTDLSGQTSLTPSANEASPVTTQISTVSTPDVSIPPSHHRRHSLDMYTGHSPTPPANFSPPTASTLTKRLEWTRVPSKPLFTLPNALSYTIKLREDSMRRLYRTKSQAPPIIPAQQSALAASRLNPAPSVFAPPASTRGMGVGDQPLGKSARQESIERLAEQLRSKDKLAKALGLGSGGSPRASLGGGGEEEDEEAIPLSPPQTEPEEAALEFLVIEGDWSSLADHTSSSSSTSASGFVQAAGAGGALMPPALAAAFTSLLAPRLSWRFPPEGEGLGSGAQSLQDQSFFFPSGVGVALRRPSHDSADDAGAGDRASSGSSGAKAAFSASLSSAVRHIVSFTDRRGGALYACCLAIQHEYGDVDGFCHDSAQSDVSATLKRLQVYQDLAAKIQRVFRKYLVVLKQRHWAQPPQPRKALGSVSSSATASVSGAGGVSTPRHHTSNGSVSLMSMSPAHTQGPAGSAGQPSFFSRMFRKGSVANGAVHSHSNSNPNPSAAAPSTNTNTNTSTSTSTGAAATAASSSRSSFWGSGGAAPAAEAGPRGGWLDFSSHGSRPRNNSLSVDNSHASHHITPSKAVHPSADAHHAAVTPINTHGTGAHASAKGLTPVAVPEEPASPSPSSSSPWKVFPQDSPVVPRGRGSDPPHPFLTHNSRALSELLDEGDNAEPGDEDDEDGEEGEQASSSSSQQQKDATNPAAAVTAVRDEREELLGKYVRRLGSRQVVGQKAYILISPLPLYTLIFAILDAIAEVEHALLLPAASPAALAALHAQRTAILTQIHAYFKHEVQQQLQLQAASVQQLYGVFRTPPYPPSQPLTYNAMLGRVMGVDVGFGLVRGAGTSSGARARKSKSGHKRRGSRRNTPSSSWAEPASPPMLNVSLPSPLAPLVLDPRAFLTAAEWSVGVLLTLVPPHIVFQLINQLLLERSLIVTGAHAGVVTACTLGVHTLLNPFSWEGLFVPLVPDSARELISAPVPFIIGTLHPPRSEDVSEQTAVLTLGDDTLYRAAGAQSSAMSEAEYAKAFRVPYANPPATPAPLHLFLQEGWEFQAYFSRLPPLPAPLLYEGDLFKRCAHLRRGLLKYALPRLRVKQNDNAVAANPPSTLNNHTPSHASPASPTSWPVHNSLDRIFMSHLPPQLLHQLRTFLSLLKRFNFQFVDALLKFSGNYQQFIKMNSVTQEDEFYPDRLLEPLRVTLEFTECLAHTQLFVSFLDRLRTQSSMLNQIRTYIANWIYQQVLRRRRSAAKGAVA